MTRRGFLPELDFASYGWSLRLAFRLGELFPSQASCNRSCSVASHLHTVSPPRHPPRGAPRSSRKTSFKHGRLRPAVFTLSPSCAGTPHRALGWSNGFAMRSAPVAQASNC